MRPVGTAPSRAIHSSAVRQTLVGMREPVSVSTTQYRVADDAIGDGERSATIVAAVGDGTGEATGSRPEVAVAKVVAIINVISMVVTPWLPDHPGM